MRTRLLWQLLLGLALAGLIFLLPILALLMLGAGGMDYYEDLPNRYLFRGGDGDAILAPLRKESIGGKVVQYAYDDTYIIARQKPDYREYQHIAIEDSLYQRIFSAKENYWIINHHTGKRYGPFSENEYQQQRRALRIPASLVLK
ncbi:DUF3997 domain-containing protein [Siphonobacter curvatus]|uniref:DUF3997 domain-containing protein n=1 Tax=Siphonobacter curvatus TaxID=2094562 RepID=A0A2S7IHB6_9BACT|nr:DUF3997 domain-containing protein [Siphonobacter curvatus]PQA55027.1 hypothetical protein C5O19_21010 [Siphonobacter curvatus]